jgi:hypothetical protein
MNEFLKILEYMNSEPTKPEQLLSRQASRRVLDPRAGRVARRGGGLEKRAVTELERKHLVETDRHIAECKEYIAKQRELIERAIQQGRSTEVAETTLESLEASLRALERQRQRLLDRLKSESR